MVNGENIRKAVNSQRDYFLTVVTMFLKNSKTLQCPAQGRPCQTGLSHMISIARKVLQRNNQISLANLVFTFKLIS